MFGEYGVYKSLWIVFFNDILVFKGFCLVIVIRNSLLIFFMNEELGNGVILKKFF